MYRFLTTKMCINFTGKIVSRFNAALTACIYLQATATRLILVWDWRLLLRFGIDRIVRAEWPGTGGVVEPAVDPPRGDGGARVGPGEHEGNAARVRPAPARARQTVRHHARRGEGGGCSSGAAWGDDGWRGWNAWNMIKQPSFFNYQWICCLPINQHVDDG